MVDTKLGHISDVPTSTGVSKSFQKLVKPELFAGKHQKRLSKPLGITQFGVNQVTLEPGSISALRHWHEGEDEFVFVLSGELTLKDNNGEHKMIRGSFAAFPAGSPNAHHLVNQSGESATFLVIGSRRPGEDACHYPDDELDRIQR